ncbi:MAG: glycoside hydrolase family 140 protein [Sulfurovum sp.]|nr:glycoside hydrolase family 140 protein [Sulfurovum sp.]
MNTIKMIHILLFSFTLFYMSACGKNTPSNDSSTVDETTNTVHDYTVQEIPENSNKLGKLKISADKRMLAYEDGSGFFWMGDTAWEMPFKFWEKDDSQRNILINQYMQDRQDKGFSVIQISALMKRYLLIKDAFYNRENVDAADHDFIGATVSVPNEEYWKVMDSIIEGAREHNLYVLLLPAWHDVIRVKDNATNYGKWIAERYKDKSNIIWAVGGDSNADTPEVYDIWNAMGTAIRSVVGHNQLISYHPSGEASSTKWFKNATWIDFHMIQSGHKIDIAGEYSANAILKNAYEEIKNDSDRKPILDAEPRYENIWKNFEEGTTRISSNEVRKIAYIQLFSGAFGHTYGHHSIWQMYADGDTVDIGGSVTGTWQNSLNDEGAIHMSHLSKLMRSRPLLYRIPDQTMVENVSTAISTRGVGFGFIYLPWGGSVTVNLGKISGTQVKAWWFNPKTGDATEISIYDNTGTQVFHTVNDDMVLVLDDTSRNYNVPGQ